MLKIVHLLLQIQLIHNVSLRVFKVRAQVWGCHDRKDGGLGTGAADAPTQKRNHLILRIYMILFGLRNCQSLLDLAALPQLIDEVVELVVLPVSKKSLVSPQVI